MENRPVRIQSEDFSMEEEVKMLLSSSRRIGAVVTFLGTVRDFSEGRAVNAIKFEEYRGMALKKLEELREEAIKSFGVIEVRIVHRVDKIEPGEQIVLVAVASEHRKEAFSAASWCIDTLKQRVPLWKKEITPDGESWVQHP